MEQIVRLFFHFDRWLGATPIGSGNINDTFHITFEQNGKAQSYLLQRLNHAVFKTPEAVMDNIVRVTTHLAKAGFQYQSPAPLPAINGRYLQKVEDQYWRCFPFLADTYAPEGCADSRIAYEAARAYGAFARALRDFPTEALHETIPGFHNTDQRWRVFEQILREDPVGRADSCEAEIEAIYRAKPIFDRISDLKSSGTLPIRVTHNDTKAGNILFSAQTHHAVAVIDLDTVMPGVILSDFGDMVRTFVPNQKEDALAPVQTRKDILEALHRGFLSETADFLTEAEQKNLLLGGAWITGEQALRFLTDWLAGDTYYKIQFPEHNLIRTRNQLSLLEGLPFN